MQCSKSLAKDTRVGKVDIDISTLLQLCENDQGKFEDFGNFTTCETQGTTADATLKLKHIDDVSNNNDLGTITVRLSTADASKAGAIVIGNAQGDIELGGIDHSATVTDSVTYRVLDAGVAAGAQQSNFLNSLSSVMSKLDLFVRFVDKAAKVCVSLDLHDRFMTMLAGPPVCHLCLACDIVAAQGTIEERESSYS